MEELYADDLAMIDVVIAVCTDREKTAVIVKATPVDKRLTHLVEFNGILAKDNFFACLPVQPGIYRCQARYVYLPPDEWVYVIERSVEIGKSVL